MISETLRKASWPIVEAFSDHPSYVAWGEGLDGVSIRVYVRGPLPGVPRVS
jgi:hypothetical protein